MAAKSLFSDAHREYMHGLYMRRMMQPAAVTTALNDRFKTDFSLVQVQRFINANWSARRKRVLNRVRAVEKINDNDLVREHAKKNKAAMARFAQKSELLADKALDMALAVGDARSMSAATSAAKNAITSYRLCAGIDGPGAGGGPTFNFNFGNVTPTLAGAQPAGVLEAEVVDADDGLDDDDQG